MLLSKALFVYEDADNPHIQTVFEFAKANQITLTPLPFTDFLEQPGRARAC